MLMILSQSKEKLQEMLDIIVFYSEENGLSINQKKTECMIVIKYQNVIDSGITLKGNPIKQAENFKYLWTWITKDGKCDKKQQQKLLWQRKHVINSTTSFTITIYD